METPYYNYWQKGEAGAQSGLTVCVYPRMELFKTATRITIAR